MGSNFLAADVFLVDTTMPKVPQLTSVHRFDPCLATGTLNTVKQAREDHNFATGVDKQRLSKKLQPRGTKLHPDSTGKIVIPSYMKMLTWLGYIDGIYGTPYIPAPWIRHGFGNPIGISESGRAWKTSTHSSFSSSIEIGQEENTDQTNLINHEPI